MARILIIDDSPTEISTISRLLGQYGYEVLSSPDAEQGIAKASAEKPDLILMDVVMPGMNGFQATRRLTRKPETAAVPVIILTSKNQETDRMWGLRQGARDYLVKPAEEADLIHKINAQLNPS